MIASLAQHDADVVVGNGKVTAEFVDARMIFRDVQLDPA